MTIEFRAWPKTPRLFRDITITEKIDGTNAAVIIELGDRSDSQDGLCAGVETDEGFMLVGAQSRNRLINPGEDNFGFANWVQANATQLVPLLGPGVHYGEWWGSGIQRGYGLSGGEKRFSLFNTARHGERDFSPVPGLGVVPVLYQGLMGTGEIAATLTLLGATGSQAAPGYMSPEGVVVFHSASRQVYKVLLENDELPKGLVSAIA